MIDDRIDKLEGLDRGPGAAALAERLGELVSAMDRSARLREVHLLRPGVARLRFAGHAVTCALFVKRLGCAAAERSRKLAQRWLPAVGLAELAPRLLVSIGVPDAECVWHVYGDLGDRPLAREPVDRARVLAGVGAIATLHARFADHPLLAECRLWGGDLGVHYCRTSLRDAYRALAALRPPRVVLTEARCALRDRLLRRLERHIAEEALRSEACLEHGGPETLLHGDLRRRNVFVQPGPEGTRVRLVDWDRAAVGPASYDLSTFLSRFPPAERTWIVEAYRRAAGQQGLQLPHPLSLETLFHTAGLARLANRLIWPAIAAGDGCADRGFAMLAEIERCFEFLRPVLPRNGHLPAGRTA